MLIVFIKNNVHLRKDFPFLKQKQVGTFNARNLNPLLFTNPIPKKIIKKLKNKAKNNEQLANVIRIGMEESCDPIKLNVKDKEEFLQRNKRNSLLNPLFEEELEFIPTNETIAFVSLCFPQARHEPSYRLVKKYSQQLSLETLQAKDN